MNIYLVVFQAACDLITYSKEQSPSWEANRFSVSQGTTHILQNPKVHYRITSARHLSQKICD
jgi:hypothetical protein